MINRRFMIVLLPCPVAATLNSLKQAGKDFPRLLLVMANMRVPLHSDFDRLIGAGMGARIGPLGPFKESKSLCRGTSVNAA